jgi:hypothetical protein
MGQGMNVKTIIRLFFTTLIAGLSSLAGCSEPVSAPTKFDPYKSQDSAFSCTYPDGWTMEQGAHGDNSDSWAKFTKGSAEIRVRADVGGSLMGDIAKASAFGSSKLGEQNALATVHSDQKPLIAQEYSSYKEAAARTIKTPSFAIGRQSDFTADTFLGTHLQGIRTTFMAPNRRVSIVCTCASDNWKALEPAFRKVVEGVRAGN